MSDQGHKEKHYTPQEIAAQLGLSPRTVSDWFRHDPRCLRAYGPTRQRAKLLIPESVWRQKWEELHGDPRVEAPRKKPPRRVEYLYPERHQRALSRQQTDDDESKGA